MKKEDVIEAPPDEKVKKPEEKKAVPKPVEPPSEPIKEEKESKTGEAEALPLVTPPVSAPKPPSPKLEAPIPQ